ncbi:MAG TPA: ATP-dependent DNA helicase RecG [Actinomycetota bacterium]|nr:ATP-dependent DNA helicase RecG [Actinomycetota bacterium]
MAETRAADPLGTPLAKATGVSAALARTLEEAFGYRTVRDLLEHYPRRYITRGELTDLAHAKKGGEVTLVGTVRNLAKKQPRRNLRILEVRVSDPSGAWVCTWFNQPWHAQKLTVGTVAAFSGKLTWKAGRLQMANPGYEVLREGDDPEEFANEVIPVYPATKDISSGRLRRSVGVLLDTFGAVPDFVPEPLRQTRGLQRRAAALGAIHRPADRDEAARARDRLVYDELFVLQVGLALRRRALEAGQHGQPLQTDGDLTKRLLASLPFQPTAAQSRAIGEIAADLARSKPMHRLLQGEVGSGKTLVALWDLLCAVQSGMQGAIMAPTEVLADQHGINLRALLAPLGEGGGLFGGPRVEVLTAATTGSSRERVLAGVAGGDVDLVVGTHALLSEGVEFRRLGAVVVDEQHRFGVHQRVRLREKGDSPHVLIMTATPIPRTLALTLYGDLDVSTLDELPPGRIPVATHVVADATLRDRAYQRVREEVAAGHQAYVVCALKDESDKIEIRSAKVEAERLRAEVFPDLRVGLVYGDMAAREKEATMDRFRAGEVDVLVSTTVIEVGVDVPNATVMLIEDADRFGLSQLHQLRGRVGRGTAPGLCILFADPQTDEGRARMEAITRTTDGFELANEDLRIRGEGTVFDARQSGLSDLKLARLIDDFDWVRRARADAFALVEADPELTDPAHGRLRQEVLARLGDGRAEWLARG